MNHTIEVSSLIEVPAETAWKAWTIPEHIIHWHYASEDWHTPQAETNLCITGKFSYRMESKDGKMGFNINGTFSKIELNKFIEVILDDGRKIAINFIDKGGRTLIIEEFYIENQNPTEIQIRGWQTILNNFKKYAEQLEIPSITDPVNR